ncbi:hypothetical protein BCAR13_60288 [Paraburkholderia caribensis]|nr:hypothetical protein BCAR13_60288 [Paraburkholderia caribensis]
MPRARATHVGFILGRARPYQEAQSNGLEKSWKSTVSAKTPREGFSGGKRCWRGVRLPDYAARIYRLAQAS